MPKLNLFNNLLRDYLKKNAIRINALPSAYFQRPPPPARQMPPPWPPQSANRRLERGGILLSTRSSRCSAAASQSMHSAAGNRARGPAAAVWVEERGPDAARIGN